MKYIALVTLIFSCSAFASYVPQSATSQTPVVSQEKTVVAGYLWSD